MMTARQLPCGVNVHESGEGPLVFLLHGVGGDGTSWRFQLTALAKAGFRAVAWDMPGYGGSNPLPDVTFDALAEAMLASLRDLGGHPAALVGHSIGAMVVQQALASHPDCAEKIVLAATSPAFGSPDGEFQKKFIAARLGPLEQGRTMADVAAMVVPELVAEGADPEGVALAEDCMSRVPPETYAATMRCLVTFDQRAALGSISVPTLVLSGEKDTNAPAPMMERMAGKIPGAVYRCIEGAGHLANLERPNDYNAALLEFLRR